VFSHLNVSKKSSQPADADGLFQCSQSIVNLESALERVKHQYHYHPKQGNCDICRWTGLDLRAHLQSANHIKHQKEQDDLDAVPALEEDEHEFYIQMCECTSDDLDVDECGIVSMLWHYDVIPNLHLEDDVEMGDRRF